jgi:Xaa-Pro dipeptidase
MNLDHIQSALRERNLDAWLFYDHHHRDPIAYRVLGLRKELMVTRRWFYIVPANGEPRKLVHRIEAGHLDPLPGEKSAYSSWQELQRELHALVKPYAKVAMQYSPQNQIPYVGLVDAGTVELVRSFDVNVVSSGDLVSQFEAVLSEEQIASHFKARDAIDRITAEAFKTIGERVRNGGTHEFEMAQWIMEAFAREELVSEDTPIVAVNSHSGDPHFEPRADRSDRMYEGDLVLLDIWAKTKDRNAVWYDITWTGFIGKAPSDKQREVFSIVRDARKLGARTVETAFTEGRKIEGCAVDEVVRDFIRGKGYGDYFIHRTGHNISASLHGNGAHIDNFETKDEREILPNTCFSIEPGVYLTEFGIRSEVNVMTRPGKAEVTGREQEELVLI